MDAKLKALMERGRELLKRVADLQAQIAEHREKQAEQPGTNKIRHAYIRPNDNRGWVRGWK